MYKRKKGSRNKERISDQKEKAASYLNECDCKKRIHEGQAYHCTLNACISVIKFKRKESGLFLHRRKKGSKENLKETNERMPL